MRWPRASSRRTCCGQCRGRSQHLPRHCPGIIETALLRAGPREGLAPLEAQSPLGRVGQPGEVAEAFVFLASEQASYITGVVLRVDGLARA